MEIQDAINYMKRYLDEEIYTPKCVSAHAVAIKEMQKTIPLKPNNNGTWCSKTCQTCGCELSIHHGDGYYSDDISLDVCPKCRQSLDWD